MLLVGKLSNSWIVLMNRFNESQFHTVQIWKRAASIDDSLYIVPKSSRKKLFSLAKKLDIISYSTYLRIDTA